jgi:hypothetical protein
MFVISLSTIEYKLKVFDRVRFTKYQFENQKHWSEAINL